MRCMTAATRFTLALALGLLRPVADAGPASVTPRTPTLAQTIQTEAKTLENHLLSGDLRPGDARTLRDRADALLRFAAAYADPDRDAEAIRSSAAVRRLTHLIDAAGTEGAPALAAILADRPRLRSSVTLLLDLDHDRPRGVAAVLMRLHAGHARALEPHADLAAAIAVVHDQPARRRVNENGRDQTDAVELFAYYLRNERRLAMPVRGTAPEMLVYVVDAAAPVGELRWALDRHAQQNHVGKLYHTITYDTNHYRRGAPKKVTEAGFNLPNIARFGGVCTDQSYYAETVGHAIGVPAITVRAVGSEAAHCWIGYVRPRGRGAVWDFSEGRWDSYDDLRGVTRHPQTRQTVSDAEIALSADAATLPRAERARAAALADAAGLLLASDPGPWPPAPPDTPAPGPARTIEGEPRSPGADAALEFLRASIQRSPASAGVWEDVARALERADLTGRGRRSWAEAIDRAAGREHADITLKVLTPLINSEPSPAARSKLWDWMFTRVRQRPDLAAEVRFRQGQMWQAEGDAHKAWLCFHDVIDRYAQDGPMVVAAADACARMLLADERAAEAADLYYRTWQRVDRPDGSAIFAGISSWNQLGARAARTLRQAGRTHDAERVERQLRQRAERR